jgi:oxygen-dependent protoporphyrinogen oxidase
MLQQFIKHNWMTNKYDAVIIGAGLTGLTVAFLLKQKGFSVLLVEKSGRTGGSIRTLTKRGYVYESGPSTASLSTAETVLLFDMLHGKCEIEIADRNAERRLILKNGRLCELPSGLSGGISTPLFTWKDKFGLLAEPFRKAGSDPNESVAALVRRRLGKSFLDYAVQPFIGGIYAGDPEKLITRFALPKLYRIEQDCGSFIKGAVKKCRQPKTELERRVTKEVFSVKGGFEKLIEALTECAGTENIRLNQDCKVISRDDSGWRIRLSSEDICAAHVVSTVGGHSVGDVFTFMPPAARAAIEELNYAKIVQVAVGLKSSAGINLKAFGTLIPSVEKRKILGVLHLSACFTGRTSKEKALLSVFAGGSDHPEIIEKSDSEIEEIVLNELREIYGISESDIDFMEIFRHRHAIPQYEIVCEKLSAAIAQFEQENQGIILAGNIRDGIGIPNRIKQAFDICNLRILSKS